MDASEYIRGVEAGRDNECLRCGRTFLREFELERHMANMHTEIEVEFSYDVLVCQLCGGEFDTKRGLGQHMKRTHKDNTKEVNRFYNGVSVSVLNELFPEAAVYAEGSILVVRSAE